MTKVYGIYGRTIVEINLPVGKATLPLTFERGCLDRKNFRPATFMTSNKAVQDMIEGSSLFGTTITLVKTYGSSSHESTEVKEQKPAKRPSGGNNVQKVTEGKIYEDGYNGGKVYSDVYTKEQLLEVVKSLGAKAAILADDEKLKNFISSNALVFPNYNFE